MILFSESFFTLLVYGGLGLTVCGVTILLILLLRDWRGGRLW